MVIKHPAVFTQSILLEIDWLLKNVNGYVLDPFAGTGRIHDLQAHTTVGVEIEPEWAAMSENTLVADALHLPFQNEFFKAIVTSPCYGNRMADHHDAKDGSKRITYRHTLGRKLHPNNSGQMQWGLAYKDFHLRAWVEAVRVLQPDGKFVLNCSDHIRGATRQSVVDWHVKELVGLGLKLTDRIQVKTPRMGFGANSKARVPYEEIVVLRKSL